MNTSPRHIPVLRDRVLALLAPALSHPEAVLIDATLGHGGHAEQALIHFPQLRLIGMDRDLSALALTEKRLAPFAERIILVHAIYDQIPEVLAAHGMSSADGILFDLGVSSMQLDDPERGFSYSYDTGLDMRMDQTTGITAAEVINSYEPGRLVKILRTYGEEKFAERIVERIVRERTDHPFTNSERLVDLIREAIPAAARRTGGNPAKRTFQALRIEVNSELQVLERAIPRAIQALRVNGRIVVMSYQSLEDRIVKRIFLQESTANVPHDLPVIPDSALPELKLLTRGSEGATSNEIAENSRAASVRLRAAERVRPGKNSGGPPHSSESGVAA
jgi:16S rRNA (cytosine1402-N4)-methyltransferase